MLTFNAEYVTMQLCMLQEGEVMSINFLTVEEFAERIKMHPGSVRRSIREGKIFAARPSMGKRGPFRIADTELERLQLDCLYQKKPKKGA